MYSSYRGRKDDYLMGKIAENTIIFDGIQYNPGDELPDLGSFVCTDANGGV